MDVRLPSLSSSADTSRRRSPPWHASERSPLEAERRSCAPHSGDYSTFNPEDTTGVNSPMPLPILAHLYLFCVQLCDHPTSLRIPPSKRGERQSGLGKLIIGFCLCVFVGLLHLGNRIWVVRELEWRWDHNAYNPRRGTPSINSQSTSASQVQAAQALSSETLVESTPRNLILVQTAGSKTLEKMVAISSRPNRAYARQWGRDYVEVVRRSSLISRACFDKAIVLHTIMEKQSHFAPLQRITYDALVLLPTDAIVMDLDFDLLRLLPEDKLVSISGWLEDPPNVKISSRTDVILFNLRHRYAAQVSQLWWDMVRTSDVTCGAGNDVQLLIQAILDVVSDDDELSSLILGLNETDRGFVGLDFRVIKAIPPSVPTSKEVMLLSNVAETRMTLQTTADSVCYRYYPKCEVL